MNMKKFITPVVLTATVLTTACSPFKQVSSKQQQGPGNRTEYVMNMQKDAQDYLEIVDVKLMNSETNASESATFKVLDNSRNNTLLNLKGYESFTIIASTGNNELEANEALIVYKDDPEGDQKSKKIKPLIEAAEPAGDD